MPPSYRNEWFLVGSADHLLTSDVFGSVLNMGFVLFGHVERSWCLFVNSESVLPVWLHSGLFTWYPGKKHAEASRDISLHVFVL